jgi:outer membrane protein OmpA-like peptidoglycan-associated protein
MSKYLYTVLQRSSNRTIGLKSIKELHSLTPGFPEGMAMPKLGLVKTSSSLGFSPILYLICRTFVIILLIALFVKAELYAQSQRFMVKTAPFSSRTNDEFSPVFYKGGIVFCSNQRDNSLVGYKDEQTRLFKIFYVTNKDSTGWKHPKILAKEITTDFNDGPVTFNKDGNIMYYSRNNSIKSFLRNISDTSNKLGIYSAEFIDGIWTNIQPFTHNNTLYSFCTPALTPNGERIYFSSDMPGGIGEMDLYYCDRRNNEWDQPVNLGPVINTPKNESFPFACKYGKLFFASDGHKGFGGKDLFYTQEINGEWIVPVHLDSAINSPADDFGIVTDSIFENGYFSTNRRNTDDIFSFSSAPIVFTNCDSLRENNYCFTFYDEQHQLIDTIPVTYQWDFGNGIIRIGKEVKHCFPGPGEYSVKLSIIDNLTGDAIAKQVEYNVELSTIEQAYINSLNVGMVDKSISFDAAKTNLIGFRITDYLWNFGDGFKPGGPVMSTTFKKEGEYTVQLGLLAEEDSLGTIPKTCVMKKIIIYDTYQEFALKSEREEDKVNEKTETVVEQNKTMQIRIYFMDDLSEQQKVKIKEALKESGKLAVGFDPHEIIPASYPFLDNVAGVLKENPGIRLESVLHTIKDEIQVGTIEISEKWAQELAFYFKNKGIDPVAFRSKGFGLSNPTMKPFVPDSKIIDGIIEFIFMKN